MKKELTILATIVSITLFSCDLFVKKNIEDLLGLNKPDNIEFIESKSVSSAGSVYPITISSDNKYLHYEVTGGIIYSSMINDDGSLIPVKSIVNGKLYFISSNNNIYEFNNSNHDIIDVYDNNLNLKYSKDIGASIKDIFISPDSKNLYLLNFSIPDINNYVINNNFEYKSMINLTGTIVLDNIVYSKDGIYLYIFDFTIPTCYILKRNTLNGDLSLMSTKSLSISYTYPVMSNNQKYMYAVDSSNIIKLTRDINSGKIIDIKNIYSFSPNNITHLAISNDDKKLYITLNNQNFYCFNVEKKIVEFNYLNTSLFSAITVSKNDKYIYCGDGSGKILTFKRTIE